MKQEDVIVNVDLFQRQLHHSGLKQRSAFLVRVCSFKVRNTYP